MYYLAKQLHSIYGILINFLLIYYFIYRLVRWSDPPYPPLVLIESSNGAKASAILYSLVETAKANTINTFEYFNLLLTEIPQHMEDKDLSFIDDLLPWSSRVQKECPSKYKKS